MSVEYHEVTVPATTPDGNRAGLSPTCHALAPWFNEGWRVNGHQYTDNGHVTVRLYRLAEMAPQKAQTMQRAAAQAAYEASGSKIAAQRAEEAVIMALHRRGLSSPAGPTDLRTPAERASDEAHAAKLRTGPASERLTPAEWRDQWLNTPPVAETTIPAAEWSGADAARAVWASIDPDTGRALGGGFEAEPIAVNIPMLLHRLVALEAKVAHLSATLECHRIATRKWAIIPPDAPQAAPDTAARQAWGLV